MNSRNNTSILIPIFVAFAMVISILGGTYIYKGVTKDNDKQAENKDDNKDINNNVSLDDIVNDKYVSELMGKYKSNICPNSYITTLDESIKNNIAYSNSAFKEISCEEANKYIGNFEGIEAEYGKEYKCQNKTSRVNYDDLLTSKKNLFGSLSIVAKVNSFVAHDRVLYYDVNTNYFYELKSIDSNSYECITTAKIVNYSANNDELNVIVEFSEMNDVKAKTQYRFKYDNNRFYLINISNI